MADEIERSDVLPENRGRTGKRRKPEVPNVGKRIVSPDSQNISGTLPLSEFITSGVRCDLFNCANDAVFRLRFSDASGGASCVQHGETLEDPKLDFRIQQIKGRGPNAVAGNRAARYLNGEWVEVNWLTLQPMKDMDVVRQILTPKQQEVLAGVQSLLEEEARIESEDRIRTATHTGKPFHTEESSDTIQAYKQMISLVRKATRKAVEAIEQGDNSLIARLRTDDITAFDKAEYDLAKELYPDAPEIAFEDFHRLREQSADAFLGMDPDLSSRMEQTRGQMKMKLEEALSIGMEHIDAIQVLAVSHELDITNDNIRRWAQLTENNP